LELYHLCEDGLLIGNRKKSIGIGVPEYTRTYIENENENEKQKMKKYLPIYIYGTLIILEGIFLLFSYYVEFTAIRYPLGTMVTAAGIFAFLAAFSRERKQVQFAYHEMHAIAMLVYGVSVLGFGDTYEKITSFTAFLLIFYAFSEIIFCNWLFNLKQKVVMNIVISRAVIGLVTGIGTVVAMYPSKFSLEIFGVLFILVGINIILYIPVMREFFPNPKAGEKADESMRSAVGSRP
jgi:uncharacterized membrane protein HdeD (DUF308 family)